MLRGVLCTAALAAAAILALRSASASADEKAELSAGLEEGDRVGAFYVTKCGGADEDGVAAGEELCYRCKLGNRAVVAVFTRTADEELAVLAQNLDKALAKHKEEMLGSFINLIGEDEGSLQEAAAEFAKQAKLHEVAVVVPKETKNGPEDYKLDPEADTTVMLWKEGKLVAVHAFADGELGGEATAEIMKRSVAMLQ